MGAGDQAEGEATEGSADGAQLSRLRAGIDQLDDQILALIEARAQLVSQAWLLKSRRGWPTRDAGREHEILQRLRARAETIPPAAVDAIFERIVGLSAPQPTR